MTSNGSRLQWAAIPLILLVTLAAAACGGGSSDGGADLASLETGACANQSGGTLVFANVTDGAEHDATVSYLAEYLAEFGYGYTTQVKDMTLAQAEAGIGNCTVHVVTGAPAGWSTSGATDFGELYTDSTGPIHKYVVAQLDVLTSDFAAALRKKNDPGSVKKTTPAGRPSSPGRQPSPTTGSTTSPRAVGSPGYQANLPPLTRFARSPRPSPERFAAPPIRAKTSMVAGVV